MGLNLNNIVVSGRLANDSETRSTREGRLVTSFGIFVIYRLSRDQNGGWQEDGFWLNVEKWEPQNAQPRQYMKGDEVVVVGKLREHVWQANDGRDMRSMRLVAQDVRPVPKAEKKQQAAPQNGGYGYGQPTPPPAAPRQYGAPAPAPSPVAQYAKQQQTQQTPQQQPPPPDVTDDDLPF